VLYRPRKATVKKNRCPRLRLLSPSVSKKMWPKYVCLSVARSVHHTKHGLRFPHPLHTPTHGTVNQPQYKQMSSQPVLYCKKTSNCPALHPTKGQSLSIRRGIKQTVITIGAYHFCQLRTNFFSKSCSQG
jgi:hypothetical protein